VALTTPLSGRFIADNLGHAKTNLPTKFEVPIASPVTEISNALRNVKNGVIWVG